MNLYLEFILQITLTNQQNIVCKIHQNLLIAQLYKKNVSE